MRAAGILRVAALALIWGSGFLWIKISLRGFTPIQLTWGRLALGASVLLVIVLATGRRLPAGARLWGHLVVAAVVGNVVPYTLFSVAEQYVASSLAGAINSTTPLWTLLLAFIFRVDRTVGAARVAGLLLGLVGALLILAPAQTVGEGQGFGALLCLAASVSYGASYVYIGRYLQATELPPLVLSAGQLTAAAGVTSLGLPVGPWSPVAWRADAVVALVVLGIVGTGIAYVLNYRIIAEDGPVLASTVTYLLPVVAVLLGVSLLGEELSIRAASGVAVVLIGVGLTRRGPRRQTPR